MAEEGEDIVDEEPEIERTPLEKIEDLKMMLREGEMGPAQFDVAYQAVWMKIKADEGLVANAHATRFNRGSTQFSRDGDD